MFYVDCSLIWNNFHLQTDEDPNTVLTLQAFEIIAQHEDFVENRPNVLTLTNGPAQVKISWKDFKDYNYVIDVSTYFQKCKPSLSDFLPWELLLIKKLEIEKTKTTKYTTFKLDIIKVVLVISISNFFTNKNSQGRKLNAV